MRLEGKVALITGAAGGIGRVAAELFAAEGARVVVADVDRRGRRGTRSPPSAAGGGDAAFVHADVAERTTGRRWSHFTVDTYGGLHVLYNNAGILPPTTAGRSTRPRPRGTG